MKIDNRNQNFASISYRLLLTTVLLAAILRFAFPSVPPSLNWDEASHGYNAFSVLKTGADEWGVKFPTIFRAYGDYKLPVYIYLTVISEFFLGVSALAIRLPSILAGLGTVFFSYLLATHLFNKKVGLLTALFVAIEPWSFFLSRGAFEANLALFFIVSGAFFFFKGLKNPLYFVLCTLFFGLSVWTYNSARIFVPIFLVVLLFIWRVELMKLLKSSRLTFALYTLIFALFFLPMFFQLARPAGQARYSWVAILDEGAINKINESRASANYSPFVERALHNKVTYFALEFSRNYINHFNPKYLFLEGGSHYQFSIPGFGLLYPINGLFILIGLFVLMKRKTKESYTVLAWLLLAPIASSLTRESPHVLRSITLLPVPMILTGVGLVKSWDWINKNIKSHTRPAKLLFVASYCILLFFFFEIYMFYHFFVYPYKYSQAWQYGHDRIVEYANIHYKNFDQIIVTKKYGEPHEFFLLYGAMQNAPWNWQPDKFRSDSNLIRYGQSDWFWVDRFDKFYFVNDWEIPRDNINWKTEKDVEISLEGKKTLLITTPNNFPEIGWERQGRIYFKDGSPAFDILKSI